jgi:hypothetical protein
MTVDFSSTVVCYRRNIKDLEARAKSLGLDGSDAKVQNAAAKQIEQLKKLGEEINSKKQEIDRFIEGTGFCRNKSYSLWDLEDCVGDLSNLQNKVLNKIKSLPEEHKAPADEILEDSNPFLSEGIPCTDEQKEDRLVPVEKHPVPDSPLLLSMREAYNTGVQVMTATSSWIQAFITTIPSRIPVFPWPSTVPYAMEMNQFGVSVANTFWAAREPVSVPDEPIRNDGSGDWVSSAMRTMNYVLDAGRAVFENGRNRLFGPTAP